MTAVKKTKVTLPAGVRIEEGQERALDAASIRLVMQGWEVKKRLEALKEELDGIQSKLIEAHGTGCALVVTGICRASLVARETVKIADAAQLKAVLGARFADLVKTDVSYRPEQKLLEMACDGDEPLRDDICACLVASNSQSVTWRAET